MKSSTNNKRRISVMMAVAMLSSYLPTPGHSVRTSSPEASTRSQLAKDSAAAPKLGEKSSAALRAATKAQTREAHGKMPLYFEANRGQFSPQVKFVSRGVGYKTFLTATEAAFVLRAAKKQEAEDVPDLGDAQVNKLVRGMHRKQHAQPSTPITVVRLALSGANENPLVIGTEQLPGKINYFRSNNPDTWVTNVPTYAQVEYKGVYPGIDMVYYGKDQQLEYDFVVAPGADPGRIGFSVDGADSVTVDSNTGDLVIRVQGGAELRQRKPEIFQQSNDSKQPVTGGFTVSGKSVGFSVGSYNTSNKLIIDPLFTYSTFLGGSGGTDEGYDIAVDGDGNGYVTGFTESSDFPTKNAIQSSNHVGTEDVFITKLNQSGSDLVWSTYLGGTAGLQAGDGGFYGNDGGYGIAVDAANNVYVTGYTSSADFPTKNAMQPHHSNGGDGEDGFVTKLNAAGNLLVFSTYLGGAAGRDEGRAIAIGSDHSVYVSGVTESYNFPTTNPIQFFNGAPTYQASIDNSGPCLITTNSAVKSSTSDATASEAAICDCVCVSPDAFLTKLAPDGQTRSYSTFLGGNNGEYGLGVAVDGDGNAYVTGWTDSTNFDPTGSPAPTPDPRISEFQIPSHVNFGPFSTSGPVGIAGGSDANLWFTEALTSKIGRITPTGSPITEFNLSVGALPLGITGGADNNLWAAEAAKDRIARVTPAGVANEFPVATPTPTPSPSPSPTPPPRSPADITAGPDGNLWFTELNVAEIGRITPAGVVTHFPLTSGSNAVGITNGPDGNLWFTEQDANLIGRITPAGIVTEFPATADTTDRQPFLIAAGPDGNLWFTEQGADDIGRITPTGVVTHFAIPSGANAFNIAGGPDGNVWFTIPSKSLLGRITPAGVVTEYQAPLGSNPLGISSGSDGNIWFTEFLSNRIGRFALNPSTPAAPALASPFATPTPFPVTPGAFQPGPGGRGNSRDAFVTKVNGDGSALVYSTYLGGDRADEAYDIAVAIDNSVYVTGYTQSKNAPTPNPSASPTPTPSPTPNQGQVGFPTTDSAYQKDNHGRTDTFVTRLNSTGSALLYSTYLGGARREGRVNDEDFGSRYDGASIAADSTGHAYVTGSTASTLQPAPPSDFKAAKGGENLMAVDPSLFPTKNAAQPAPGNDPGDDSDNRRDAYVAKFDTNAAGEASLIYSTFLGGDNRDEGLGIAIDLAGNAYVTGFTVTATECVPRPIDINNPNAGTICEGNEYVNEFPTTPGAFQQSPPGTPDGSNNKNRQAFVTKIGGGINIDPNNPRFSVVGRVTGTSGIVGIGGITITVTQNGVTVGTASTDTNGFYEVSNLAPGSYDVTPSSSNPNYAFLPPNQTATIVNQNVQADFRATIYYSISGRVTQGSTGLGGVTITVTKQSDASVISTAITDSNGNYTVGVLPADNYIVTPTKPFYTFTPPNRTIEALSSDQTNVDFAATLVQLGITGHITTSSGAPLSGVLVTLSGDGSGTTTTNASGDYSFSSLTGGGNYTVTPSRPNTSFTPPSRTINGLSGIATADFTGAPGEVGFTAAASPGGSESSRNEGAGSFQITITRTGDASGPTDVDYATFDGPLAGPTPQPSPLPPAASERSDYITALGRLHFAAGVTTKTVTIFIIDDAYVEGNEVLSLVLSNPTNGETLGASSAVTLTIVDNDLTPTTVNPIDNTAFFVRQHYLDFLNREPDAGGLAFWSNEINRCSNAANRGPGETEAQCIDRMRVQVSKAFFLSIEFQETGFFVIRTYRAALHRYPDFREFLRDTQEIQRGVVVGQGAWQTQLENNKQAYLAEFVSRPEFLARYPQTQTRDQYLDALFVSADFTPTTGERLEVSNAYDAGANQADSRARALRALADHARFRTREFNPSFILMQYIGYLRRNPDEPGFNFWLTDLNGNNNYDHMVKAFLISGEYRQRFGP